LIFDFDLRLHDPAGKLVEIGVAIRVLLGHQCCLNEVPERFNKLFSAL